MKKYSSWIISNAVWELVNLGLESNISDNMMLETFYNCREQGFVSLDYLTKTVIWVYAHRNSDKPTVIISNMGHRDMGNMYDEEAWNTAQSFDTIDEAARYIIKKLEEIYHGN